jgi:glycosylphosphatidylinositol transamidase (GPIT) subunit GPI8
MNGTKISSKSCVISFSACHRICTVIIYQHRKMVKKILFASANPNDTRKLDLDKEAREIQQALKLSKNRDDFEIVTCLATRVEDLRRALLDEQPNIVHFSGHGTEAALVLEDSNGLTQLVSESALESLFENFRGVTECVVLNACYSEVQAKEIYKHINCVIGMNQPIGDSSAINFAIGFYDAVFSEENYDYAFNIGLASMQLSGSKEHLTPVQLFRPLAKSTQKNNMPKEKSQPTKNETYQTKYDQRQANIGGFVDTAQSGSKVQFTQNINAVEQQKNLAEAAKEIQQLLEQLSKTYPTVTMSDKMKLAAEATQQIEQNPTLMQKIISALKAGSTTALEQSLNHPAASFVIAAFEDLQKN